MISSVTSSASDIQMDYMKLLLAQLQNQNPLEPLNNNEMASQLAQLSQLQQLESMNTSFAEVLATAKQSYAGSLIGKKITFVAEDKQTGESKQMEGLVDLVLKDPDTGGWLLGVRVGEGGQEYAVGVVDVLSVKG